jgi:cysteine sulfinate desulfinase/cysteine desulfurase-like protein
MAQVAKVGPGGFLISYTHAHIALVPTPSMTQVAKLVGADPKEIIFTSGATESNNLAIKGVAMFYREKKKHIITTQTEHKCVLDSCR